MQKFESRLGESAEARYDLADSEVAELCTQLLNERGNISPDTKYSSYVLEPSDSYTNLARSVEAKVFGESFDNGADLLAQEYVEYEEGSTFFLVIDNEEKMPVGVMRVLTSPTGTLKSLDDIEQVGLPFTKKEVLDAYGVDGSRVVDIATIAVLQEHRGQQAGTVPPTFFMYRMLYKTFIQDPNYNVTITMIDKAAERSLKFLHFPFMPVLDSGYFEYLGSPQSRFLIANNPDFHPIVTQWADSLANEAQETGSQIKAQVAQAVKSFADPSPLDKQINY